MDALLAARFAQSAAAVVLAGTLAMRLLAWKTRDREALRWNGLARGCWGLTVLAGVAVLVLTTAAMTGETLANIVQGHSLGDVLAGTRFGAAWLARVSLLAGMFAVGLLAKMRWWRDRPQRLVLSDAANALLASAVLITLVWASHAHASARSAWLWPANAVHVLAAGAWPGGLLPLAILLARARRDPTLLQTAVTVTRRFSRLSAAAVAVLASSGLLNACGIIGALPALWSSQYGRLLLCKVAFFLAMIGLGFINRRLIRRDNADASVVVRRLCLNVGWESVLAVAVLLVTEALATCPPPHD